MKNEKDCRGGLQKLNMATSALSMPWQCEQCGARFYKEILLRMHHDNFHCAKNKRDDKMIQHIRKILSEDQSSSGAAAETQDRNEEYDTQNETEGAIVKTEQLMDDEGHSSEGEEVSLVVVNNDGTMYMVPDVGDQMEENEQMAIMDHTVDENIENVTTVEISVEENAEAMTSVEGSTVEIIENTAAVEDSIDDNAEAVTENLDETVTEYTESFHTIPHTILNNDKEFGNTEREQSLRKIMFNVSNFKQSNVVQDRELPSFPCKRCDQVFSTRHDRRMHWQTHARDLRFFCTVCGRGFYKMALLRLHSNVHVEGKRHQCSYCLKYYRSEVYLKKHMLTHTQQAVRYECGVCGQQYELREHMRVHMRSHEQPRRAATLCNVCGQNYVLEGGRGGLRMRCPECDSKFRRHTSSSPGQLEDTRLSDSSERPYACAAPGCLKSFRHPGHLRRHYATHADDLHPDSYRQCLLGETPHAGEFAPQ